MFRKPSGKDKARAEHAAAPPISRRAGRAAARDRGLPGPLCLLATAVAGALVSGCGPPTPDISSADGKQQILDEVNADLSFGDCVDAVNAIQPLYDSQYTDNNVRLLTASAYGCDARVQMLSLFLSMAQNISTIQTGFFTYVSQLFYPSVSGQDYVVEGALSATDALLATLNPGAVVLAPYQVNPGTYNVGSEWPSDRTGDSNLYMIFIEMAAIGGLQNRYGDPSATTFQKQTNLPWNEAGLVDSMGAAYAASVLNFFDAIEGAQQALPSSLSSGLGSFYSTVETLLNYACDAGCNGTPTGAGEIAAMGALQSGESWQNTGCAISGGCPVCPRSLRDRTRATGSVTDVNSCAAAGIVNFVNTNLGGWP